jgi:hypothetical protein
VGDVVLILKRYVKKGHVKKLTHLWRGPYIVTNKFPNQINYEVKLLKNGKGEHVVHASNMKRFTQPHTTHLSQQLRSLQSTDEKVQEEQQVEESLIEVVDMPAEKSQVKEEDIEEVLDVRYVHRKGKHSWDYLVKLKNQTDPKAVWLQRELLNCSEKIHKFEQKKQQEEQQKEPAWIRRQKKLLEEYNRRATQQLAGTRASQRIREKSRT